MAKSVEKQIARGVRLQSKDSSMRKAAKRKAAGSKAIEKPQDGKDVKMAHVRELKSHHKLKKSITPGTILILLAGRFQGKRVVFLKQLDSGLLLVTGPMVINGVPLRRVDQAYVIATSTKINDFDVEVDPMVNDLYFKKEKEKKAVKKEEDFFKEEKKEEEKKSAIPDEKTAIQKEVDKKVIALIKEPYIKKYLGARFRLSNHCYPHRLLF